MNNIEHLAFVLDGKKTWVHWNEVYPNYGHMLHVIQITSSHVIQLVKVDYKHKLHYKKSWFFRRST